MAVTRNGGRLAPSRRQLYTTISIAVLVITKVEITHCAIAISPTSHQMSMTANADVNENALTSRTPNSNQDVPNVGKSSTKRDCPNKCVCNVEEGETIISCARSGISIFPTILREKIPSSSWRFAKSL